jgi:hypothetical protein
MVNKWDMAISISNLSIIKNNSVSKFDKTGWFFASNPSQHVASQSVMEKTGAFRNESRQTPTRPRSRPE